MPQPWTTSASASIGGADGIVTLVEGSAFCISSRSGEIAPAHPQGLFFRDTRFLSELRLHAQRHARPSRSPRPTHRPVQRACSCCAATRRRATPTRTSWSSAAATSAAACAKTSRSRTTARKPRSARSSSLVDADFADLFEVKEGRVQKQGELGVARRRARRITFTLRAAARSRARRTSTSPATPRIAGTHVALRGDRARRAGTGRRASQVTPVIGDQEVTPRYLCGQPGRALDAGRAPRGVAARPAGRHDRRRPVPRAARPLDRRTSPALRIFDPEYPDRAVVAAGAPWFMTLFGRDSLLTSWMTMLVDPDLALGTLQTLARFQGNEVDPRTEEEPGRILHEMRFGETASLSLGGGRIYYGTVDATPLFVMLLGELSRWGNRRDEVDALLPAADRALAVDRPSTATATATATSSTSARPTAGCRTRVGRTPGTRCASPTARSRRRRSRCARCRATCTRALDRALRTARPKPATTRSRASLRDARRRAEAPVQRRLLGRRATAATSRSASTATSSRSTASARTWATASGPASSTRRRRRSSRARLLSRRACSPGGASARCRPTNGGLQPDLVPLRQRVAARQRDLRGRPDALRLRRRGAPRDARASSTRRRGSATCCPSCSRASPRDGLSFPVSYPTSCSPQAWAAASPLLFLRTLLRFEPDIRNSQAAPRARGARLDRHAAPRAHPDHGRPPRDRGRRRPVRVLDVPEHLQIESDPRAATAL